MSCRKIEMHFNDGFHGELTTPKATALVGSKENELAPYDMLFGALASCLYATFLEIAIKKRVHYDAVHITVDGHKREKIPTTLEWVEVVFTVTNPDDGSEKGLEQAMRLATEYCSIYQTLSHVAEMRYEIRYVTV